MVLPPIDDSYVSVEQGVGDGARKSGSHRVNEIGVARDHDGDDHANTQSTAADYGIATRGARPPRRAARTAS